MQLLASVIVGICSSIAAAAIFLYVISRFRPRISIAQQIAKVVESNGEISYCIKIIDKSRRGAFNIRADLFLITRKTVPDGTMLTTREISLQRQDPLALHKYDTTEAEGHYAYRFRTNEDIDSLWDEDEESYLRFRVFAVDSFTGFGRLFTRTYDKKDRDIVEGEFQYGKLKIVPKV